MAKRFKVQDLIDSDNTVSVISHQLRINNEMSGEGEVKVFNLEKLHPNVFNPRKLNFSNLDIDHLKANKPDYDNYLSQVDEITKDQLTELLALASSIDQSGLLQPIVVTDHPTITGDYMVVAGERRYWSHILLGRTVIRAVYRQVDEKGHRTISIAENLARHDLNLKEKVIGLKELMNIDDNFNKAEHVMKLFGVRKSAAYMLLKLAKQDSHYTAVLSGQITQFRDSEEFEKKHDLIESTEKIPTVGKKTTNKSTFLKLNKQQTLKLAELLLIDASEENLIDLIVEKLS